MPSCSLGLYTAVTGMVLEKSPSSAKNYLFFIAAKHIWPLFLRQFFISLHIFNSKSSKSGHFKLFHCTCKEQAGSSAELGLQGALGKGSCESLGGSLGSSVPSLLLLCDGNPSQPLLGDSGPAFPCPWLLTGPVLGQGAARGMQGLQCPWGNRDTLPSNDCLISSGFP